MSRRLLAVLGATLGLALVFARPASADKKTDPAKSEPFFHQFLVPGDPLDDRILAQEGRIAQDPNSAALRNDFGNMLAQRRFPKEARAEYRKALKLDPNFYLAAYNLGMLEETEGNVAAAMSAYKEAIDRRRGFPPAHFRLGHLYEMLSRNDEAVQEYARAIWIDSAMRDPRFNPLVVESRLMDQASLANYERDLARGSLAKSAVYVEPPKPKPVATDRPLDSEDVAADDAGPQTIETGKSAPQRGSRAPAPGPGRATAPPRATVRPGRANVVPRPAQAEPPPAPTPVPAEAPPPPEPEPEPQI